jgi:hypothetical protein
MSQRGAMYIPCKLSRSEKLQKQISNQQCIKDELTLNLKNYNMMTANYRLWMADHRGKPKIFHSKPPYLLKNTMAPPSFTDWPWRLLKILPPQSTMANI